MIDIDVRHRLGTQGFDVRLATETRGVTAFFGPSGAGKTTIANMIAGLVTPEEGRIAIDGLTVFDSAAGIDVRPEKRRIGYVFQEGRLFPHLDVRANLLYGFRRAPASDRRIALDPVVRILGIGDLLDRRPHHLSGGEKQRVALGRALLANPTLLLMDEPLAALDGPRKAEVLPFIEALRDEFGIPIVYVTHAVEEIVRLADTLVLVSDGRIAASGAVEDLMGRLDLRPFTGRYEAGAVFAATVEDTDTGHGLARLAFAGGDMFVPGTGLEAAQHIRVRIRARDVALATAMPSDISILNRFEGTVAEIAPPAEGGEPGLVDVSVDIGAPLLARITRHSAHHLGLAPGSKVYALVKAISIDRQSLGMHGASLRRASSDPEVKPLS